MKRRISTIVLFFFIGIAPANLIAQDAISVSGGDVSGTGGTVAYSIGQVMYTATSTSAGQVNSGVQQPYSIIMVGNGRPIPAVSIEIYPNPANDNVVLKFSDPFIDSGMSSLSYALYDIYGQVLLREEISDGMVIIPVNTFASAMYMLKVLYGNAEIKTFKVIKTN